MYLLVPLFFSNRLCHEPSNQVCEFRSLLGLSPEIFVAHKLSYTQPNDLIDFASSASGGKIIKELSTVDFFQANPIENVISDNNEPGLCWGFKGKTGHAAIRLAEAIKPKSFEMVYLNSLNYSAAPKEFSVFGLKDNQKKRSLGNYTFDLFIKGAVRNPSQTFSCQLNCQEHFSTILLEISENYGNPFTYVYQFKIHGSQL